MMKYKHYIIILLTCIFTSLSYGQTEINASLLEGTWKLNITETLNSMEPSKKVTWNSMQSESRERISQRYKDRKILLSPEGDYTLTLTNGQTSKGTWLYNSDTKTLKITHVNGKTSSQKVQLLNDSELVLVPEQKSNHTILLSKLYYTKN